MTEPAYEEFESVKPIPPSVTARLYDADAEQRVGLTLKQTAPNGRVKKYTVAHVFRAMADEDFFKYEDKKAIVQKVSGTDILNVRTEDKSLRAAEWLWDTLAIRREGYKTRPDWKEKTNLLDKQTTVEKGLLAVFVADESDEVFEEEIIGELFDDEFSEDSSTVIRLDCLFNQEPMTTIHYFNEPSAADVDEYERTMRKANNLLNTRRGFRQKKDAQTAQIAIPSKARELCALYDRLIIRTEGYAGRVPAHHKREAVLEIFSRDAEVTEKNS